MAKTKNLLVLLLPYNAARRLRIMREKVIVRSFVKLMIPIDDGNRDKTVAPAKATNQVNDLICERDPDGYRFPVVMIVFRPEK